MKIFLLILLAVIVSSHFADCSLGKSGLVSIKEGKGVGGFWKARIEWKAHWVKNWKIKTVYIPVWQKIWGPVELKEWIPFPDLHKM